MTQNSVVVFKLTRRHSYLTLNQPGGSCLTAAANGGHAAVVAMLLDAKADVNQYINVRYSPTVHVYFDDSIMVVVFIDIAILCCISGSTCRY
jgi:hypothetical protein